MNVERLEKLANFLETVPIKRFDMTRWAHIGFDKNKCGTRACAGGWATTIFEKDGLKICPHNYLGVKITYNGLESYEALAKFFDITIFQSVSLFCGENYKILPFSNITTLHVINRIRDFINDSR